MTEENRTLPSEPLSALVCTALGMAKAVILTGLLCWVGLTVELSLTYVAFVYGATAIGAVMAGPLRLRLGVTIYLPSVALSAAASCAGLCWALARSAADGRALLAGMGIAVLGFTVALIRDLDREHGMNALMLVFGAACVGLTFLLPALLPLLVR